MTISELSAPVAGMPRIGDPAPSFTADLGRNFDELLRVIKALQTADHFSVATPADWRPGDRVIVPPAGSCGSAKERMDGHVDGVEREDWFFCTKELSEQEVESAIRGA